MKRPILLILILSLLGACKKDEKASNGVFTRFLEDEILVSDQAGKSIVTVQWSQAEWEISTEEGGFLSNLQFLRGGSLSHSSSTRIQFDYAENNTDGAREQELVLKSVTAGEIKKIVVRQLPKATVVLAIDPAIKFQHISGFGGMLNPALWQGNNQLTEAEVEMMFGPGGLGYRIMRIMIYPDPSNWNRDLAIAKKAQSLGVRLFGSPWTPPAHMKSSGVQSGGNGGYLLPEHYQAYVDHLNAFVDFMSENGVTIEAVSIQNEPDWDPEYDACVWTPAQILTFMRDFAHGIKVKVIAAEAVNFKKEYTDPVLNDAVAVDNLDIVGTHLYGGGITDYPLARQHNKEVWMTEHLHNTNSAADYSFQHALILGKELHDCMRTNFNAYIYWYLKRHYSMLGDGEYGSPVGEVQKRGYLLSHYAQYATGRQRIEIEAIAGNSNFLVTAYEGQNDYTIILQNQGAQYIPVLQFDLPSEIGEVEAVETTAEVNMMDKRIATGADRRSIMINIKPMSVVSIRVAKALLD